MQQCMRDENKKKESLDFEDDLRDGHPQLPYAKATL
jgi:hypothetical protein